MTDLSEAACFQGGLYDLFVANDIRVAAAKHSVMTQVGMSVWGGQPILREEMTAEDPHDMFHPGFGNLAQVVRVVAAAGRRRCYDFIGREIDYVAKGALRRICRHPKRGFAECGGDPNMPWFISGNQRHWRNS